MDAAYAAKDDARPAGTGGSVIPVDIAAAKALAIARPQHETECLPLLEARGRVLARHVGAPISLPPFDNSAMDGYAVSVADLTGGGPWRVPVCGRVVAGANPGQFEPMAKACIRIFTGAPVPAGFDAVIMQEQCERAGDAILIAKRPRQGENIRRAGEDVRLGDRVMGPGDCLTPQRLALLAGLGLADAEVFRKVRIGLISTGTELRNPGDGLANGQIYNSNRVMIRAIMASYAWAEILDFGIVPDLQGDLAAAFGVAARRCDVLVTTGGVSAGEEDHVVAALDQHGGTLDVLKVAMRPGKPLKIGRLGDMLFAGLPGNPNAALVTFRQIALPAIRSVAGLHDVQPDWLAGIAGFNYSKTLGRTEFVPVRVVGRDGLGRPVLEMLGRGSSANLSALAMADGIALLPPDAVSIESGARLRFQPFCDC
ncbi:MAG: molybdopterin molybdotransferase MoeA [Devosia sp.]